MPQLQVVTQLPGGVQDLIPVPASVVQTAGSQVTEQTGLLQSTWQLALPGQPMATLSAHLISHSGFWQTMPQLRAAGPPMASHASPTMTGISTRPTVDDASQTGALAGVSLLSQEQVTGLQLVVQVGGVMKQPKTLPHAPVLVMAEHFAAQVGLPHVASHSGHALSPHCFVAQVVVQSGGSQTGSHLKLGAGKVQVWTDLALPQLQFAGGQIHLLPNSLHAVGSISSQVGVQSVPGQTGCMSLGPKVEASQENAVHAGLSKAGMLKHPLTGSQLSALHVSPSSQIL